MNGDRSPCCNGLTLKDATGDVICTICGTIIDNYPEDKEEETIKLDLSDEWWHCNSCGHEFNVATDGCICNADRRPMCPKCKLDTTQFNQEETHDE